MYIILNYNMDMNGMSYSFVQNDTLKDSYKTSLDRIIQIPSTLRFSINDIELRL